MSDVDINVMRTFTEFYAHLLGFINYKLFSSIGIAYPPQDRSGDDSHEVEFMTSLNRQLLPKKSIDDEEEALDKFDEEGTEELKGAAGLTIIETALLQKLFDGLVVFLNREVPREPLVFVLRSFGARVSWDRNVCPGSTFAENDENITHQIVDRNVASKFLNRVYVQPQWVFDSINARKLMNVQEYFPGTPLPPHLSPFVEYKEGDHVTPDVVRLGQPAPKEQEVSEQSEQSTKRRKQQSKSDDGDRVIVGRVKGQGPKDEEQMHEEKKLAVMMIPKKKKQLYDRIVKSQKRKQKAVNNLKSKRALIDSQ